MREAERGGHTEAGRTRPRRRRASRHPQTRCPSSVPFLPLRTLPAFASPSMRSSRRCSRPLTMPFPAKPTVLRVARPFSCVPELSAVFSKARPCSWAVRHVTCESPSPSELSLGGRRVGGSQSPSCISSSASQRLTPSCRKESPFTYTDSLGCGAPSHCGHRRGEVLPVSQVWPISGTDPPGSGQ